MCCTSSVTSSQTQTPKEGDLRVTFRSNIDYRTGRPLKSPVRLVKHLMLVKDNVKIGVAINTDQITVPCL